MYLTFFGTVFEIQGVFYTLSTSYLGLTTSGSSKGTCGYSWIGQCGDNWALPEETKRRSKTQFGPPSYLPVCVPQTLQRCLSTVTANHVDFGYFNIPLVREAILATCHGHITLLTEFYRGLLWWEADLTVIQFSACHTFSKSITIFPLVVESFSLNKIIQTNPIFEKDKKHQPKLKEIFIWHINKAIWKIMRTWNWITVYYYFILTSAFIKLSSNVYRHPEAQSLEITFLVGISFKSVPWDKECI